jgi:hypothetical protein
MARKKKKTMLYDPEPVHPQSITHEAQNPSPSTTINALANPSSFQIPKAQPRWPNA